MNCFGPNLKYLRKQVGYTQSQLAGKLGINRATLASYEEERAEPKFENLKRIASFLKVSLDDLLLKEVSTAGKSKAWKQRSLQILPILVDQDDHERISVVKEKATAGYLKGMEDPEFIEQLPTFNLPFENTSQGTYRAFEISGNSMLPVPSGSFIIAQYEDQWKSIKDESPYIVVSQKDGLTYKRISIDLRKELVQLKPDNPDYQNYSLPLHDIREFWRAVGYISFNVEKVDKESIQLEELSKMFKQLKSEVDSLKYK